MLTDLRVQELGVIDKLDLRVGDGLTAITGETGAGKTLIVEALELLCGGRADPAMVRAQADEANVEARFVDGDDEHIVSRSVPRDGRARAELNNKMVAASVLEELASRLVDLHGQHSHQSLLRPAVQRAALDRFAKIDHGPAIALRNEISAIDATLGDLGGDEQSLERGRDLVAYELAEIDNAQLSDPQEDVQLEEEETALANALQLKEATEQAVAALDGATGPGATDLLGVAIESLAHHQLLQAHEKRLRDLQTELGDATSELRRVAEGFEENPQRLAVVRERRQLLVRLQRKYGDGLVAVLNVAAERRARLAALESSEEQRAGLFADREQKVTALAEAEQTIGNQRRAAAPALAAAVEAHLHRLALTRACFSLSLEETGIADNVEFQLSANAGEPAAPLAKIASGGELARCMLAVRLVLSAGPPTLIFDEVDAGIGGETALAVGEALGALGNDHQVLVVTHLAQVAAFADHHLVVEKEETGGRTVSRVEAVTGERRVAELARMLSGQPDSQAALGHAQELLTRCQEERHQARTEKKNVSDNPRPSRRKPVA